MITAEEFLKGKVTETFSRNPFYQNILIEFAELHVRQALLEAIREAPYHCEEGVLNCYPSKNIK
jgi:hypothetical protein